MPSILRNLDLQITIWENLTSRKKTLTSKLGPAWENIAGNHCGKKKIAFSVSDTGGTLENKLNNLKPLFDLFSHKKCFTFWKWSKKMLLHIRRQILPTRVNNNHRKLIWLSWPLSMKQTLDWHMSIFLTSWANQVLHSLASRGFQNPGGLSASISFLPEVPLFHFLALVSYACSKTKNPFPEIKWKCLPLRLLRDRQQDSKMLVEKWGEVELFKTDFEVPRYLSF